MLDRKLRVCLDARIPDGTHGGVQQVVLGLAHGLASLPPGPEEYLFLVEPGQWDWLRPHMVGPCRPLEVSGRPPSLLRRARHRLGIGVGAEDSDGTAERARADVVHQTLQSGFRTRIPSIYVPYDLQHVHLSELFPDEERRAREAVYPDLCGRAALVMAISRWGAEDLVRTYGLARSKVRVVYMAQAIDAYAAPTMDEIEAGRRRLGLPSAFALYPAQTWPHKNHLALIEALSILRRDHGLEVPLVLTGKESAHFAAIEAHARALGVSGQVRSLGFVSPRDLRIVYASSHLLVFPSRFEGFGMPIVEAFRQGVPVACSSATSLPEVAGGAAELFDPDRPEEIAATVQRAWTDAGLRSTLVRRGHERVRAFSWTSTAARCRALYREVAGRALDAEDRRLLAETALHPPRAKE